MRGEVIRKVRLAFILASVATCFSARATVPPLRDQVPLNGIWERGGTVPVYTGNNLDVQTYERRVNVPAAWMSRRIRIDFTAVNYAAEVFVNGMQVA